MSDVKVIVLRGASPTSWEDAVRQVVRQAAESVDEITGVDVVHQSAETEGGVVIRFHVTVHVSFLKSGDDSSAPSDRAS